MKKEEKQGWQMVWASVGLMIMNFLLGFLFQSPEVLGLNNIFFNVVVIILCVIDVVAVYILVRKFFGKKK